MPNLRLHLYGTITGAMVMMAGMQSAAAQDAARGRELYENNCADCHYQRVHQRDRDKSLVRNLDDLRAQVSRWAGQTRRPPAGQDLADIVEYLNRSYYKLEK